MSNEDNAMEVVGTPTMMLLPARNYKFKVYKEDHVINIPRKGTYVDFDDEQYTNEDGEFDILTEKDGEFVLYTPSITKVLFAASKYPKLDDGFAFVVTAFVVKEDSVDVIGNLIEMMEE